MMDVVWYHLRRYAWVGVGAIALWLILCVWLGAGAFVLWLDTMVSG